MAIGVIGSGLAGLAASDLLLRAGLPVVVFEASPHWGGHTYSRSDNGFVFDEGPHVSFTKDQKVIEVFAQGAGEVKTLHAAITNAFRGGWITHPAQCHLYGLDSDLVTSCIVDYVVSQQQPPAVQNYADWCVAMFGKTFAETFPFAYTRKYWTMNAEKLSTDWVGQRMYPPKIEEVIRGAISSEPQGDFHYLTHCRYPSKGGYQSFTKSLYHPEAIRLNHRVVSIDLQAKRLMFVQGQEAHYDHLISTMPLPDLIRAILPQQVPVEVRAAAEKLLCSSLVLVDIAVNRPDLSKHHWFYVYDENISFARVHFPHMLSPHNVPPGCGSIQVEVYHSPHRQLPCKLELLPERVVEELIRLKVLHNKEEVLWARHRNITYANVIFDFHRTPALSVILPWIQQQGIALAGRYAEWDYLWTDDATRSGWRVAQALLQKLSH